MSAGTLLYTQPKLDLRAEVVVLVGSEQAKFTVPEAFLTKSSTFFQASCHGEWKESKTKAVELPETEPETFGYYYQWLAIHELVMSDEGIENMPPDVKERGDREKLQYRALLDLGTFADSYGDEAFANDVGDALMQVMDASAVVPSTTFLRRAYSALPSGSKIRALIADQFALRIDPENLKHDLSDYPHELLHQIWIAFSPAAHTSTRAVPEPSWKRRCKYHEHDDKVPKTGKCTE